jgi:hypothetical protein
MTGDEMTRGRNDRDKMTGDEMKGDESQRSNFNSWVVGVDGSGGMKHLS